MSFSTGTPLREEDLVPSQLTKKVFVAGSGPTPPSGCEVTVHYTGRLTDGTVFDSSVNRGDPFKFKIGQGQVIKGWDEGVATMKKGEKSLLICSPDYAYGAAGSPPTIPANSTLHFEVELLSFNEYNPVDGTDGLVKKKIIKQGTGYTYPNDSSTVKILIQGKIYKEGDEENKNENNFLNHEDEEKGLEMTIAEDPDMATGLEESVKSMKQGETAIFLFNNDDRMGFAANLNKTYNISPNDPLYFKITLLSFQKGQDTIGMTFDQKVAHMARIKDIGNKFFKAGKLTGAYARYKSAVDIFKYENNLVGEELAKVNAVRLAALSNSTIIRYKEKNWNKVIEKANEALAFDPLHVKCLFKRAQAEIHMDQLDKAEVDLKKCLELDPNNIEIKKEYQVLKAKTRAELEKEKKRFGGWFNKVTLVTDEEIAASRARDAESAKKENGMSDSDSDEEFDESAKPSPMPEGEVANPPLPVEKGPQEGLDGPAPMEDEAKPL